MKTVILCGGKGTRMREETEFRPKPLVLIGDRPIIWHIMKIYSHYGYDDFLLCLGYKGELIKRYFVEMNWLNNDFTIDTDHPSELEIHSGGNEHWKVTLADTGLESQTGSRIRQIEKYVGGNDFMLTYGDGLSDVNLRALAEAHRRSGKIATLTGVHPTSPFGIFETKEGAVTSFKEKPVLEDFINGGFMALNKRVFDYIPDTDCAFEQEPLHTLARAGELAIFPHEGFWTAIDTLKDVERVNAAWSSGNAPWKIWD
jgi:glucose-1-phosphate cytidylyltransferase